MVKELEENILQGRINKVNNLSTDEFVFSVRKGKNLKNIVIEKIFDVVNYKNFKGMRFKWKYKKNYFHFKIKNT